MRAFCAMICLAAGLASILMAAGCSDQRQTALQFDPDTGKHSPPSWLPKAHSLAAANVAGSAASSPSVSGNAAASSCTACHGPDLSGGISGVSCASCHLGGPMSIHPETWNPVSRDHMTYVRANGSASCSNRYCHGAALTGVPDSGPSCGSCHLGGAGSFHPSSWTAPEIDHAAYAATNGASACSNIACHGPDLAGKQYGGPSCTSCHLGGATRKHPASFVDPVALNHADYVKTNGTGSCSNQYCHGASLSGVAGSGPACASACHLGSSTSIHLSSWTSVTINHGPYAKQNGTLACRTQYCHGDTLGGVAGSGPSCTSCHLGSPTAAHPTSWDPVAMNHSAYVRTNGAVACSVPYCHGTDLSGVTGSGPSCSSCHLGGAMSIHPASWTPVLSTHGHHADANGTAACSNQYCHGATLGGVSGSGPSCNRNIGVGGCHDWPFQCIQVVCTICHRYPPAGTTAPDVAGAHAKHTALGGVTCDTCHNGAGAYACDHTNGAVELTFQSAYYPKSGGTPSYDSATDTCSDLRCHGGPRSQSGTQAKTGVSTTTTTPTWRYGSINVAEQCAFCHVYGFLEDNSYSSGQHRKHVYSEGILCTTCHDATKLTASHFTTLGTSSLEGPASAAIRANEIGYINGTPRTCNPQGGAYPTGCHDDKDWP
jgi:predicted CxxxxCH...CXXCH cytochrome family protein